jgi:hypothetical protein
MEINEFESWSIRRARARRAERIELIKAWFGLALIFAAMIIVGD